ncbi:MULTISPECIES: (Fe-S)-binding protein [Actinomadura]|uniref:L-lactate dehydrogenase complex protein LldE n=1 Tax=Actinomadura madurae TaxID=1993 RepID=A0A1I5ARQ2_9ACTN|nr:(Fe-S)-binding protein [Actinomadura madurae]MCP9948618.1 (Fe-S)-binding protein [Actinomadura madurae]MCP9977879.1 (Fe-S)-binding protein [Actinomadura madurae]URM94263.1 (Fe-S)-binding protein [Actinomadura madurae]URN04969.1 (Fe-S)-binding protein [Actinomadura madurae]SFN65070.1 L-lactate dehydrogenase complex protein LldE [Actinomadura madurae]
MKVALFLTCVNDTMFPGTGKAVVRLLRRLGHDVEFPETQTCCGQMHLNTGYRRQALPLVKGFAETFEPYDAIVTPSASCGAMIRDWHPRLAPRSAGVASRVYELSEFLVDVLGVTDVGAYFPHRVTYHPTCHSLRMLHVGDRPLRLLREVRGIDLVDLPDAAECCGFGGTFALKNSEVSAAMCADKVTAVRETRAEALCAADNSCLMHIGGALTRTRAGVRAVHLAEILASTEEDPSR